MHRFIHRRGALRAGLALGATLLVPSARACEYFADNLRITHPWCRATAPGATSVIVSMKFDEVTRPDRLIGVETMVAEGAELGGRLSRPTVDFEIPEGVETHLGEHGTYLRLTGLKFPLEVARTYPLKLTFEHGGVVGANLNVDYARFF
ncbi:copper chaperone PCu(A)C [Aquincola sp. MAHUQ-54]|uniref:Copper chaperone PCu(A)C n=1 Tax=Aquincola agrisoli TaxID=3119538 RepID=A0AAW9QAP4_9BURK